MPKAFKDLTEQEILALAISSEDEDGRIYGEFAQGFRDSYPATAEMFKKMMAEESEHRRMLIELHQKKFGEHIPLIRRQDVKGFIRRKPIWLVRPLGLDAVRKQAENMEFEAARFYEQAAQRTSDASIRKFLGDLAEAERQHERTAGTYEQEHLTSEVRDEEDAAARRMFVLQVIQPGLAGLMDGSVSTLAPLFAAAFATGKSRDALLVGFAASVGAGISMGFAEALSDDGSLTGRGKPLLRGVICGRHDLRRRPGPHAPVPDPELYLRHQRRCDCRDRRAGDHFVDSLQVHGYPIAVGGFSGDGRGGAGLFGRHSHRPAGRTGRRGIVSAGCYR